MGKEIDIGVSQVSRKVKAGWIGVNNISRKIKAGWIGDASGVAKLFYEALSPQITFTYTSTNPSYPSGTVTFTGNDNCQQLRTWITGTIGDGSSSSNYRLLTGTLSGNGYGSASQLFYLCTNITTLDVSNFDTSNVTNMIWMFFRCDSVTSLDVSNFDTSNVTDMFAMFYSCKGLTTLNLNSFDTSKVTEFGAMFQKSNKLKTIYCNSTWTGASGATSTNMFKECDQLVGAISYNISFTTITYANPTTGYFTRVS